MGLKLQRKDINTYHILDEEGDLIYMAIKLQGIGWGAFDCEGGRIDERFTPDRNRFLYSFK